MVRRAWCGIAVALLVGAVSCVTIEVEAPEGGGSPPRIDTSGAVVLGGGPGGPCDVSGVITYNGVPVKNEPIKCFSSQSGTPATDTTGEDGSYDCTVPEGNIYFEARGDTSGYCEQPTGTVVWCNSTVECNPNISGCAQPSVQWTLLLPLPWALWRRRRRGEAPAHERRGRDHQLGARLAVLAIAAGLVALSSAPASAQDCDASILDAYVAVWQGDEPIAKLDDIMSETAVKRHGTNVEIRPVEIGEKSRGKAKESILHAQNKRIGSPVKPRLQGWTNLEITINQHVMFGDHICVVRWEATGDHKRVDLSPPKDYTAITMRGVTVLKISDAGLIVEETVVDSNDDEVLEALEYK